MKYSSPLKLFPELDQMSIKPDASFLVNLKKRMLAEFQLNGEMPIHINGAHYSKHEILDILDKLKENNSYSFHLTIWKDKDLLNFLENNTLPQTTPFWSPLKTDEAFLNFVSPYFAEKYNELLAEKFKQGDTFSLKKIIQLPTLVNTADEPRLYTLAQRLVYRQLKELNLVVEQLDAKTYKEKPANLRRFYENSCIISLNALPDAFSSLRNQYSVELINLYVQAYNSLKRPELAEEIILNASRLNVDSYERNLLNERVEEIKKLRKGSAAASSGDNSVWIVLKVIGIVLYIIIMIARGCGNSKSSSYTNTYNLPDYSANSTSEYPLTLSYGNDPFILNDGIISGLKLEKMKLSSPSAQKVSRYHNRPETGEELFANVDSILIKEEPTSATEDLSNESKNRNLFLVNNSAQDAAILIASEKAVHRFLRKNDSLLLTNLPEGKCEIIVYTGKRWNPSVCFTPVGYPHRCCGMFDPLSIDQEVHHDKSIVFFSSEETNHKIDIQDSLVAVDASKLSKQKRSKMQTMKRAMQY